MRVLIVLLFGGVLWGTPIFVSETPADSSAAADYFTFTEARAPESNWGLEQSLGSIDELEALNPQGVKQAFLADYPPGVTMGQLRVVADANLIAVPRGNWDDLILSSAGGILAVVMALYAILLLAGLLVEVARTRVAPPYSIPVVRGVAVGRSRVGVAGGPRASLNT